MREMPGRPGRPGGGRGAVRLGFLLFLLLLVGGFYLATLYGPAYWTYLSMFDPVQEAANTAASRSGGEEKARRQLLERARAEGLELDEEAVQIVREEVEVVVRVSWTVPINLPRYPQTLHFSIEKRSPLS